MHLDSNAVREMRLDRGWTQQQLADACGVSMRTVQRVEKDGVASLETTAALGSVFGVERRALLRVSSREEVGTVETGSLRLVLLGILIGFVVGVVATLTIVSSEMIAYVVSLVPENPGTTGSVFAGVFGILRGPERSNTARSKVGIC